MKFELKCGAVVQIDEQDALKFVGISMWVTSHGYVRVFGRHGVRERYLHREIMGADSATVVDHINGDKLDNRRQNLRLCTQQQNSYNSRPSNANSSGVKGVYWCNKRLKWVAQITHNQKTISLGRHVDFHSAVAARQKKEAELFGEYSAQKGVLKL
jgi:hypothetical protein